MIKKCNCCGEKKEIVLEEHIHRYWCEDCLDIAKKEELEERDLWDKIEMRQLVLAMYKDLCADDNTFHTLVEQGAIDKKYDFQVHMRYKDRIKKLNIFGDKI